MNHPLQWQPTNIWSFRIEERHNPALAASRYWVILSWMSQVELDLDDAPAKQRTGTTWMELAYAYTCF